MIFVIIIIYFIIHRMRVCVCEITLPCLDGCRLKRRCRHRAREFWTVVYHQSFIHSDTIFRNNYPMYAVRACGCELNRFLRVNLQGFSACVKLIGTGFSHSVRGAVGSFENRRDSE